MPTYQYACPDCGHKFEIKQKFTDDPLKRCPNCQRRHVYRVVSQVAVTFKGSGWYITDSKRSSDKRTLAHKHKDESASEGKTEVKSESAGEATSESKAESKPEVKADAKASEAGKNDSKPVKAAKP